MMLRLNTAVSVLVPRDPDCSAPGETEGRASHAKLVDLLLEQAGAIATEPDLAMLAYADPDDDYKTVASYLNMRTGGRAHSFALCGQGLGAPFTALRVAGAYAPAGRQSTQLLAIVESGGTVEGTRAELDSGVLLGFDPNRGSWYLEEIHSTDDRGELAAELTRLAAVHDRLLVIMGPGVDPTVIPVDRTEAYHVAAGSYCTSVWLALANLEAEWAARYLVIVLADTDSRTGTSHLAVLRTANGPAS